MADAVYIAGITTRLPRSFSPGECMDVLYPPSLAGGRINRLARRAAQVVGIESRSSVLDPDAFPTRVLARPEYRPLEWCRGMVEELSASSPVARDVGCLGVAYNVSSSADLLPSLAAQVASAVPLALDVPPEERAFYGCAGGLFSLESGLRYCREHERLAALCVFDQCSWIVDPVRDPAQVDFRDHLRTSLLFSDGAAGLLLAPRSLRRAFRRPLMRLLDVACDFVPGASVRMDAGRLVFTDELRHEVPRMVSERLIRPMLARHGLEVGEIDEWAMHQGGLPILAEFRKPELLGLSSAQLDRATRLFQRHGNFSAPSCLFVLDSFFAEDPSGKHGRKGMIVSFGAGYYMGAALYEWEAQ
jgi:predicted naringenin-chalcone synthase